MAAAVAAGGVQEWTFDVVAGDHGRAEPAARHRCIKGHYALAQLCLEGVISVGSRGDTARPHGGERRVEPLGRDRRVVESVPANR